MNATRSAPAARVLSEDLVAADPMMQFARWLADAEAAGLTEPTAMVLAPVSGAGHVRGRTVLLKDHGQEGFTFYTNRTSRKGRDLAANPQACVTFPWYDIERQVIAEGRVRALSQAESEPYFRSRPRGSQISAWASRQSSVIPSRAVLADRVADLERRLPEPQQVPMPDFWGGYPVGPEGVRFWQGGPARLQPPRPPPGAAGGRCPP